jgi:glutamyl-tRNA synthetase
MKKVRVRFAPSPTGPLHIGGVRTALYNYLFAKKHQGDFILRIEDTDQTRFVPGAEEYIVEALKWCGIEPNEGVGFGNGHYGPYKQSERKDIYFPFVEQLINEGKAYYAFDTTEELDAIRKKYESEKKTFSYDANVRLSLKNALTLSEDEVKNKLASGEKYVVRIKINPDENIVFNDMIRGNVVFNSSLMDDKVLYKSDGLPTYHMANVVDDYLMKISHVIRGEEWLPSAPLHVVLYNYLGWENEMPQFAHLPLILKPDGHGKLSKRDGDRLGFPVFPLNWQDPFSNEISSGYREAGYLKEAFINILAFLGWNPGTEQEIFSMKELIEEFSLERVGKSGAKFDPDKARWFNQQYIKNVENKQLAIFLQQEISSLKNLPLDFLIKVCGEMKERITFIRDIYSQGIFFFEKPSIYDEQTVQKKWKPESAQILQELISVFNEILEFKADKIEEAFKSFLEKNQIPFGTAMISLRLVITGQGSGPSLFHIMEILGKEESIQRIIEGRENLK